MAWWAWLLVGMGVALVGGTGLFVWACFVIDAELTRREEDDGI
jgi:hypothetical protein